MSAAMRATSKRILFTAALACAVSAGSAVAGGPLQVWAIGLPNGYVVMEHQARVLDVSAEDAANGVVEVRGGSRLVITLKCPAGYAVDLRAHSGVVQAASIEAIGRTVELESNGGVLVQPAAAAGRHVVTIDYRFVLAPDTVPGTYAWPLDLWVRALLSTDRDLPNVAQRLALTHTR
jgi:hypothetical protein